MNIEEKYYMESNGCFCGFNMPPALISSRDKNDEHTYGLPPYRQIGAFLVDKYPGCPDNWMKSEGNLTSYFVPIKEGNGMWLDFNRVETPYHLAIVISIQGVNPLTGMPCNDPQLEQYIEKCPKHKTKFGPNRYCKKCGFKWPKQNYISTTGTPEGSLWLDGFRAADGVVRQYILTEEKMRGVASNTIGKDRVYAIGISFFLSKEQRPQPIVERETHHWHNTWQYPYNTWQYPYWHYPNYHYSNTCYLSDNTSGGININNKMSNDVTYSSNYVQCCDSSFSDPEKEIIGSRSLVLGKASSGILKTASLNQISAEKTQKKTISKVKTKKLEIGAGAKISQKIYDDPNGLDFWDDKPESIICINYCDEKDVEKIIEQGEINLEGSKEGFMQNIPVGN